MTMNDSTAAAAEGFLDADPALEAVQPRAARGTGAGPTCMPEPGSDDFADLCRSFDRRPLGYRAAKRAFDVAFSACIVAAGIVPCALLALAVAVDTKGSPIYSQVRAGKHGRPFRIYKFRSMVADSDDVEKHLTPEQLAQWERERKVDDDPRVTPLGRIIRKTSIDELPQLLNVLLGQISLVGPRPITYEELGEFGVDAAELLSVEPGVTGLWQVTARNDATFESGERQRIELEYARGASPGMDARCLLGTVGAVLRKGGTGR